MAPLRGLGYHAVVMRFRQVTLLLLIYFALDFANPMMPGAVQLVGGSLETVAGCQARTAEVPAPAVTAVPGDLSTLVPQPAPSVQALARAAPFSPPTPVLFRTSFEPRSTAASSSDDD